jgi:hypothetical protein
MDSQARHHRMLPVETLSSRQLYATTSWSVREDTVRRQDGSTGSLTLLGALDITPSTLSQRCHVFLATDLTDGTPQREPEEQDMRSAWFSRTDVERMIADGTVTDSKSIAAYALLLLHH